MRLGSRPVRLRVEPLRSQYLKHAFGWFESFGRHLGRSLKKLVKLSPSKSRPAGECETLRLEAHGIDPSAGL